MEGTMNHSATIDVTRAYLKSQEGSAMLVCAYADDQLGRKLRLQGALTYGEFLRMRHMISQDLEIIFYSRWDGELAPAQRAEQYRDEFADTHTLLGGVIAWRQAGHPMAEDTGEGEEERTPPR